MISWKLITYILTGKPPPLPNSVFADYEELLPEGLTMGTLYIGRQGTGKTSSLARHIVDYAKAHPLRAIFILDWSGSITDGILNLILQEKESVRSGLLDRLVYDELGNPEVVTPLPEFSREYGDYEEQVQRVSLNLARLAPELVRDAPFLAGLGLREIAPQIFRVITSISENGETWEVTEAKKLITDKGMLLRALALHGGKVPGAKWFLETLFLKLRPAERELRTYALLALLGTIEAKETRARIGYPRPGWTPREAIKKGLIVIVNGSRLINQQNAQHYLFTQVYSLIISEINKRQPGNPMDQPVALVLDEVYSLLTIPGMAEEIGTLAPLYRSRKLELYIVLQALSQLAPNLREKIWSIGNIVCFAVSNFEEALEISRQLFTYEPAKASSADSQSPSEPGQNQYLGIANKIQRLNHRECLIRRFTSERLLDKNLLYVAKTKEVPAGDFSMTVRELKQMLLEKRGVRVEDALAIINKRSITATDEVKATRGKPPQI